MVLQRGFQPRSHPRSKRQVAWGLGPDATPVSLGTTVKQLWTTGIILVLDPKSTIVRIRGEALLFLQTNIAATDGFSGGLGIGIVSSDAFAAGAASCPGALTDSAWDGWMWHTFFHIHSPKSALAVSAGDQAAFQRITIDSKAMRKIGDNETLIGSIEANEEGTATGQFWADTRLLLKLT